MAVPTWLSGISHLFGDVLGGMVGATIANLTHELPQKAGEKIQQEFEKRMVVSPEDREDVLKALLRLQQDDPSNVDALIELLKEMQPQGFLEIRGRRYLEAQTVSLLMKVDSPDRGEIYPILNEVCRADRGAFFALLNIVNDDGWMQAARLALAVARDLGVPVRDTVRRVSGDIRAGLHELDMAARADLPHLAASYAAGRARNDVAMMRIGRKIARLKKGGRP